MARGTENQEELNSRKYGIPLYGAAWVPPAAGKEDVVADSESPGAAAKRLVVFAGGGGEGHSGIPNALLLSAFDLESNSLSDEPVRFPINDSRVHKSVYEGYDAFIVYSSYFLFFVL